MASQGSRFFILMSVRRTIVSTHRWLSIAVAGLWLLQTVTGIFAVFHWEIDDATVAGPHRAADFAAIERAASTLAPPGSGLRTSSIWSSAGFRDRFDVHIESESPGNGRVVRVDGAGNVLRVRNDGEMLRNGGWVQTLVVLHQSLLSGDRGRWFLGVSGLLLLSNLGLGLVAAWPRAGQWGRALQPSRSGSRIAVLFSWHRAFGLWLAVPAMCVATAGVLLAFERFTERLLNPPLIEPAMPPSGGMRIGMAEAVAAALERHPAAVSGIGFPAAGNATWAVTLRQPREGRRAYGKTQVLVSAVDGSILADFDAVRPSASRRFVNLLFPFHTGEMFGFGGRVAVLTIGLWLLGMIALGVLLFLARREATKKRPVRVDF